MTEKSVEEMVQHMEDVIEIENLLGRYQFVHMVGMQQEMVDMYAQKTPGVRFTCPLGVYEGIEGVRRFYLGMGQGKDPGDRAGIMQVWPSTTLMIEVAGDGKTAKGMLVSPGAGAGKTPDDEFQARWHWLKVAFDFVKEDGKWKFWHFHIYQIFATPYERSFIEGDVDAGPEMPDDIKEKIGPDRTISPEFLYSPTMVQELIPVPPEPYETFDEKIAY